MFTSKRIIIALAVLCMSSAMYNIWLHYKNAWAYYEIARLNTEIQVRDNKAVIERNNQVLTTELDKRTLMDKELKGKLNENVDLITISNTLKSLR